MVAEASSVEAVWNRMIARAAAIWRPLAASQDALATDGLTFLRGLLSEARPRRA